MALRVFLFLLLLSLTGSISAAPDYPKGDDDLVLTYDRYSLKLAVRDPTPMLRIYGSGRAVIYYSAFSPLAGKYQVMLSRNELDALMSAITQADLHRASTSVLRNSANAAEQSRRNKSGELYYSSDATISLLRTNVNGSSIDSTLLFENLQETDGRLEGIPQIKSFAGLERRLMNLVRRPDRVRIGNPTSLEELMMEEQGR